MPGKELDLEKVDLVREGAKLRADGVERRSRKWREIVPSLGEKLHQGCNANKPLAACDAVFGYGERLEPVGKSRMSVSA